VCAGSSSEGELAERKAEAGPRHGKVADRGVVLSMAAKATSRPEGRPRLMGNSGEQARDRTQSRITLSANLTRVNEAAKRSRQTRFTVLAALPRGRWLRSRGGARRWGRERSEIGAI
jgi:hypothetical protein